MAAQQPSRPLSNEPAPQMPDQRPKAGWKKPLAIVFGIIGAIASTSTVVALVWNAIEPDTTQQDQVAKLDGIERKLSADQQDARLVNQVSRRVTALSDEYGRIQASLADIRRLAKALDAAPKAAILTADQQSLRDASRKKEIAALIALLDKTEQQARRFVSSVTEDELLDRVEVAGSRSAQTKTKAVDQAKQVREQVLTELAAIRAGLAN
jgi:hypothetical protein